MSNAKNCECSRWAEEKSLIDDLLKAGRLTLISRNDEPYLEKAFVRCNLCQARWHWERDDSYHYPIVRWSRG